MGHSGYLDFHCHLDDPCYDGKREEIIGQCFAAGFTKLVVVADPFRERSLELTAEMAASHTGIDCTVGAHPHQADQYTPEIEKRILAFLGRSQVLAIGEVGLDFHYDHSSRENQFHVLKRQIAIARECSLPLVIHSRHAEAPLLKVLDEEKFPQSVAFHCYTGDQSAADEIVLRGDFISFSGIITFKKAEALRRIVASVPLGQLFSETDSPYLAPEPDRGKTNTPLAVIRVVETIAELKHATALAVMEQIEKNFTRLKS
jgi:TatD DNase family protein